MSGTDQRNACCGLPQVEDTVLVLFTKKMFRWNTTDFLYFRLSVFVFINVGQFLAFPFLKKVQS
jgi:hypothetical protein